MATEVLGSHRDHGMRHREDREPRQGSDDGAVRSVNAQLRYAFDEGILQENR